MIGNKYIQDGRLMGLLIFVLIFTAFRSYNFHFVWICSLIVFLRLHRISNISFDYIHWDSIIAFLGVLSLCFLGYINGNITIGGVVSLLIPCVTFYVLGYSCSNEATDCNSIYFILYFFSLILALPNVLLTLIDISENGLINPERNLEILAYSGQDVKSTARSAELALPVAWLGLLFLPKGVINKSLKRAFIMLSILSFLCIIHFLSRTGIVCALIGLIIGVLFYSKKNITSWLIVAIILVLVYIVQDLEIFRLYQAREIEGSSFLDAGGRFDRWQYYWNLIGKYPLGMPSSSFDEHYYAHNFWLDAAKDSGMVTFVLLVFMALTLFKRSIKIGFNQGEDKAVRFIVFLSTVSFIAALFVEPIHEGVKILMIMYYSYCGLINGYYRKNLLNSKY